MMNAECRMMNSFLTCISPLASRREKTGRHGGRPYEPGGSDMFGDSDRLVGQATVPAGD